MHSSNEERGPLLAGGACTGTGRRRHDRHDDRHHDHRDNKKKSTLIEPVLFLFCVATGFANCVVTDLLESAECSRRLSRFVGCPESSVQPAVAQLLLGRSLIEAVGPAAVALLVGPRSDRNGRKPFLLVAIAGACVSSVCWAALSWEPVAARLPPAALLLASLPVAATGGATVVSLLAVCYVTDVTDRRSRPTRMCTVALCAVAGGGASGLAAPAALRLLDGAFPPVFLASALLLAAAALYAHLRLHEPVDGRPPPPANHRHRPRRSLSAACHARRADVLLIVVAIFVQSLIVDGESTVTYLATRQLFGWRLTDFALYSCAASVAYGAGAMAWSRLGGGGGRESAAAAAASLALVGRCVALALRRPLAPADLYAAALLSAAAAGSAPLCRARLAALLPPRRVGDVFACVAFLESVCPVASAPLYTQLYRATLAADPFAFYALSAALSVVLLALLTTVAVMEAVRQRWNENYPEFEIEAT